MKVKLNGQVVSVESAQQYRDSRKVMALECRLAGYPEAADKLDAEYEALAMLEIVEN